MMKRTLVALALMIPMILVAQSKSPSKKYQGLLWEIRGPGLKKPSYLFGTMHVSSKLAFHLADSFYLGIRNADVVALETNPESWQEDMSKYDLGENDLGDAYRGELMSVPGDYFNINTLRFYKYEKKVERALYSNPSTINNLLYRTYGNESSDFEEDTYLDMYIYQCGKKWGKKVAGVEKYGESMKLMSEAYKDAAKDRTKKERSYDTDDGYSSGKLQEAYRSGNLDWLDSINRYNSFSQAFDEKFLYKRNEIQAMSIDSILHSGQSLFVGVGAAHLPGNRGVIEILRRLGYKLRPVKMGARDSQHKNQVEKLRVPVQFTTQHSDDGWYRVDIPGKFYKFGEETGADSRQYADMANGSYYMVTRIMTNSWMWGNSHARVEKIVDSLLYENIPGKIVTKTAITRNGYPGIDLTNKTRRGDMQRYNIFITPFEILVFKMSGTGEYVLNGEEARRFFGSIQLKESKVAADPVSASWIKYSPPYGGFNVALPREPFVSNDGSWIFDADDKSANTQYRIIRTDIHNYHFVEEDSFDLGLMEESFASSEFIDKQLSRKQGNYKGYPALDCQYKDKYGGQYTVRYLIQGPHYYTLVAHGKQETPAMKNFFNSFEIRPLVYPASRLRTDTTLYYTVSSPVFPEPSKEKLGVPAYNYLDDDDYESAYSMVGDGVFKSRVISNDSTGEKVFISFFKMQRYTTLEDSSLLDRENQANLFGDTAWIVRSRKKFELSNGTKVWENVLSDTASSRTLWTKTYYRKGVGFSLVTQSDSLSQPSAFLRGFFDSFSPADTIEGIDPFSRKSKLFFEDFMSSDSVIHKRAVKGLYIVKLDSSDLPDLRKAIARINWMDKRYMDTKKSLIGKLQNIPSARATDFLKELYFAANDTLDLQFTVLEAMLQQQTPYSYQVFRDIVMADPPILNVGTSNNNYSLNYLSPLLPKTGSYYNSSFMDELFDTLQLTRKILPDLLPLMNLEDYESQMLQLLGQMVDSGLVKPKDYDGYFPKILIQARQELKKQAVSEKQKNIQKAEELKEKKGASLSYMDMIDIMDNNKDTDTGNEKLKMYGTLLLPFWDKDPAVKTLMNQMLASGDKKVKYATLLLMLRNKKSVSDTMVNYFAGLDEYRYRLYSDLRDIKLKKLFPSRYDNQASLAKSRLMAFSTEDSPDSIVYLDRLPASVKEKKGYVYFFKYKAKKDDLVWRIASIGLLPEDSTKFDFEPRLGATTNPYLYYSYRNAVEDRFSGLGSTKFKPMDPVTPQLQKELKRLLYSQRKSSRDFYQRSFNTDGPEEMLEGVEEEQPSVEVKP